MARNIKGLNKNKQGGFDSHALPPTYIDIPAGYHCLYIQNTTNKLLKTKSMSKNRVQITIGRSYEAFSIKKHQGLICNNNWQLKCIKNSICKSFA